MEMQDTENRSATSRDSLEWLMAMELTQAGSVSTSQQRGLAFALSMTPYGAPFKSKIKLATASFETLLNFPIETLEHIAKALNDNDAINMLGSIINKSTRESWLASFDTQRQSKIAPILERYGNAPNRVADQMLFLLIETVLNLMEQKKLPATSLDSL